VCSLPKIKTPEKLPSLLFEPQMTALIQYKPKNRNVRRIHMMVLVVLDTDLRVDKVSHTRKQEIDMENLLLTVRKAKGG